MLTKTFKMVINRIITLLCLAVCGYFLILAISGLIHVKI